MQGLFVVQLVDFDRLLRLLVLLEVHAGRVPEEIGDEGVDFPVVGDSAVVFEVLEDFAEGGVVLQALDVSANDPHVVEVDERDNERGHEEGQYQKQRYQENEVEGVGAEHEGEKVGHVLQGHDGVGRVDAGAQGREV